MNDTVIHGDALSVLRGLADNSVDAIVSDPPAGIKFMNKPFDDDRGGRNQWVAWLKEIMIEAKRVIKPGGHALIWALPRTSHWTATALEDAGFEVRDKLYHLFGSGFPKSTAIDKQIDKMLGKEREVIEVRSNHRNRPQTEQWDKSNKLASGNPRPGDHVLGNLVEVTAPATPEAQRWQGYGTALKPSCEEWILCRKPLAESSIAAQVLATGTGGLAIDACRVGYVNEQDRQHSARPGHEGRTSTANIFNPQPNMHAEQHPQGRFPSHLLLSHSLWCVPRGTKRVRGQSGSPIRRNKGTEFSNVYGTYGPITSTTDPRDPEGMETVEAYDCAPDCPIAELDRQSGVRKSGGRTKHIGEVTKNNHIYHAHTVASEFEMEPSTGMASRYFQHFPPDDYTPFLYQSKASRAERNRGLPTKIDGALIPECEEGLDEQLLPGMNASPREHDGKVHNTNYYANHHPTVKSTSLMRWLIRLITPPDGIVLDPFCGSGSTCVAAIQEGKHFIGIEQSSEYCDIANARIAHAQKEQGVTVQAQEYDCAPDCPVRILGEQSGERNSSLKKPYDNQQGWGKHGIYSPVGNRTVTTYDDQGTAARYFQQFPPDSLWCDEQEEVPA